MPPTFTRPQLEWFMRQGLGNPTAPPKCKGRATGCPCQDCVAVDELLAAHDQARSRPFDANGQLRPVKARRAPRQPWHARPSRHAASRAA